MLRPTVRARLKVLAAWAGGALLGAGLALGVTDPTLGAVALFGAVVVCGVAIEL